MNILGWSADFSFATLSAPQLMNAGFNLGRVRYILGQGKQISVAEFREATNTPGHALALVQESFGQAAQRGYNQGVQEAKEAFARADQLGWPRDRPIYFVCEDPTSVPSSQWKNIEQYLRGVASIVPVSRIGDYGSAAQIRHMQGLGLTTYGWAVETWPGQPVSQPGGIHMIQMYNHKPGYPFNMNGQVDPNAVLEDDWGQWSAFSIPTFVPRFASGQENKSVSLSTGPDGARVDLLFVAVDGSVHHWWATDPTAMATGEGRGGEMLGGKVRDGGGVSGGWTADGKWYVACCDGIDDRPYLNWTAGDGKWSGWHAVGDPTMLRAPA